MKRQSLGQICRLTSTLHPIPSVSQQGPAPLRQLPAGTGCLDLLEREAFAACRDRTQAPVFPPLAVPLLPHQTPRHVVVKREAEASTPLTLSDRKQKTTRCPREDKREGWGRKEG